MTRLSHRKTFGLLAAVFVVLALVMTVCLTLQNPRESAADSITRVAIIGDSYTGGSGEGGRGSASWPYIAARELHTRGIDIDAEVSAHGGSGYVTRGTDGTVFADAISDTIRADDEVVVIFGGLNDAANPPNVEADAVRSTLTAARDRAPGASLIVVGPAWPDAQPIPQILAIRDVLAREAASTGARFVDPIAERWFMDQPQLIGDDRVHPTDDGHVYMAQRLTPVLQTTISALGVSTANN